MRPLPFLTGLLLVTPALADTPTDRLNVLMAELPWDTLRRSALGVTRRQTMIPFFATAEDVDPTTSKVRLLLLGGLDDGDETVKAVVACLKWFHTAPEANTVRDRFSVTAV